MKLAVELALECSKKHEWVATAVALDEKGPIFDQGTCPECGRLGRRQLVTSSDIEGLLTPEEIERIGQEKTLLLLLLCMRLTSAYNDNPEDVAPRLTAKQLSVGSLIPLRRTEELLYELDKESLITREEKRYELNGDESWEYVEAYPWNDEILPNLEAQRKAEETKQ